MSIFKFGQIEAAYKDFHKKRQVTDIVTKLWSLIKCYAILTDKVSCKFLMQMKGLLIM